MIPQPLMRLMVAVALRRSGIRVAFGNRWVPGVQDDLYFRARVIESAAGLPMWSLSGNVRTFLSEGPERFPEVDPTWFATKDSGLARQAYLSIAGLLKADVGELSAEELYQDAITGLGRSRREDLPGALGSKYSAQILGGTSKPQAYRSGVGVVAKRRALDVLSRQKTRSKHMPLVTEDPLTTPAGGMWERQEVGEAVDGMSPLQAIALVMSGPRGRKFLRWAEKVVQRSGSEPQQIVFDAFMRNPGATNRDLAAAYESAMGSSISPQMAGRHRDNAVKSIKDAIVSSPQVLDWVQDALEMRGLHDVDAVQLARLPLRWKRATPLVPTDRDALIRLASQMDPGSPERETILAAIVSPKEPLSSGGLTWIPLEGRGAAKAERLFGYKSADWYVLDTKIKGKTVFMRHHGTITLYVVGPSGHAFSNKIERGWRAVSREDVHQLVESAIADDSQLYPRSGIYRNMKVK